MEVALVLHLLDFLLLPTVGAYLQVDSLARKLRPGQRLLLGLTLALLAPAARLGSSLQVRTT